MPDELKRPKQTSKHHKKQIPIYLYIFILTDKYGIRGEQQQQFQIVDYTHGTHIGNDEVKMIKVQIHFFFQFNVCLHTVKPV